MRRASRIIVGQRKAGILINSSKAAVTVTALVGNQEILPP